MNTLASLSTPSRAATPALPPALAATPASSDQRFARLLDRQQQAAARPAPARDDTVRRDAEARTQRSRDEARQDGRADEQRQAQRRLDGRDEAAPTECSDARRTPKAEASDDDDEAGTGAAADATAAPVWPPALPPPPTARVSGSGSGGTGAGDGMAPPPPDGGAGDALAKLGAATGSSAAPRTGLAPAGLHAGPDAGPDTSDSGPATGAGALLAAAGRAAETGTPAAAGADFERRLADALATPAAAPHDPTVPAAALATPAATAAPASPLAARETAAPLAVPLGTPLDSPEFGRAFGVQLSVLAKDGVQQAELHLNPAEMGPVSVQIAIDGTQARVEFGADLAVTRQAIETSLPELAAALREAGLTLAGGGVSQQSQQSQQSQHSGAERRSREDGDTRRGAGAVNGVTAEAAAAPQRRLARIGGVDLYA